MAIRFFRRMRILPGVSLNLSKSGPSISVGPRGAKFTVGPRGVRTTAGLPGTGLYYTKHASHGSGGRASRATPEPAPPPADPLDMGRIAWMMLPAQEKAFVSGLRKLRDGDHPGAIRHFSASGDNPDALALAGFLHIARQEWRNAANVLHRALGLKSRLGAMLGKYRVTPEITLAVTDEITAHLAVTRRGALLALTEAHQRLEEWQQAIEALKALLRYDRDDVLVRLSLAELLLEAYPGDTRAMRYAAGLGEGVENATAIHAALLLYRARALRGLGLPTAARETLTPALRRTRERPPELLRALRYERVLAYEAEGNSTAMRRDLERLYAEDPRYEDVAARLGL